GWRSPIQPACLASLKGWSGSPWECLDGVQPALAAADIGILKTMRLYCLGDAFSRSIQVLPARLRSRDAGGGDAVTAAQEQLRIESARITHAEAEPCVG